MQARSAPVKALFSIERLMAAVYDGM